MMHSFSCNILALLQVLLICCQAVPLTTVEVPPQDTSTKSQSEFNTFLETDSNLFASQIKVYTNLLDKYKEIEKFIQTIESDTNKETLNQDLEWLQEIIKEKTTNNRVKRANLDLVDLEGVDANLLANTHADKRARRRQVKMNGRRNGGRRNQATLTRKAAHSRNNFETPLNRSMMLKFPYKNVVRVTSSQRSGCTGILLDNRHVLTAAHCVHNQTHFLPNCNGMRVLLPYIHGFKILQISTIRVPYLWLRHSSPSERKRHKSYDYAIIKLEKATRQRQFMPFGLENHKRASIADTISYSWYPRTSGRFNQKRKTCRVELTDFKRNGDELNVDCDSEVGSSGSAVILKTRRYGTRIIGVVSNKIINTGMDEISVITTTKLINICSMIAIDYRISDYDKLLPESCQDSSFNYDSSNYVSYQKSRTT